MCLPGIDGICDYDSPYCNVENEYVVAWQDNGEIYSEYFEVLEYEDDAKVFARALESAQSHDTLLFYCEIGHIMFNPKTGKHVETPIDAEHCKHYYDQPVQPPCLARFTPVETDELPF